jgi:hypothetical protein
MSVPPLPPEAFDLIRAGAPQPRREAPALAAVAAPAPMPAEPMQTATAVPVVPLPRLSPEKRRSPVRVSAPASAPDLETPLVQESYRLPPALLRSLSRACYERKEKRQRPFRRQDIVAAALERWLRDEGYLNFAPEE